MNKRLIITEGERDAAFVNQLLVRFDIKKVTAVAPSRVASVGGDGWPNAMAAVRVNLTQMNDGAVQSLAIVVDADYAHSNKRGYRTVLSEYQELLKEFGFTNPNRVGCGLIFRHNVGLLPLGLWILPDTQSDGMLENLIVDCLSGTQQSLLNEARKAVDGIQTVLFNRDLHLAKAQVATWLAWQRMPGRHLASAVADQLLDFELDPIKNIRAWLKATFD